MTPPLPFIYLSLSLLIPTFTIIISLVFYILAYVVLSVVSLTILSYINLFILLPLPLKVICVLISAGCGFLIIKKARLKFILPFTPVSKLRAGDERLYGAKSVNLSILKKRGFNVPEGYALSARFFRYFLRYNRISSADIDRAPPTQESNPRGKGKNHFRGTGFSPFQRLCLFYILQRLKGKNLIVRSSFSIEDSGPFYFAGQFRSIPCAHEIDDVEEAIKACWSSWWSIEANKYRESMGIENLEARLSVILQVMEGVDIKGTFSSVNLASGQTDQIWVEGKDSREDRIFFFNFNKILNIIERGRSPFDNDMDTKRLIATLDAAARLFPFPVNGEWGVRDNKVYLFQARPLKYKKRLTTFTNQGMVDITPEPLSRMTLSLIEEAGPLSASLLAPYRLYSKIEHVEGDLITNISSRLYANYDKIKDIESRLVLGIRGASKLFWSYLKVHNEAGGFFRDFTVILDSVERRLEETMSLKEKLKLIRELNRWVNKIGLERQMTYFHFFTLSRFVLDNILKSLVSKKDLLTGIRMVSDQCVRERERRLFGKLIRLISSDREALSALNEGDIECLKSKADIRTAWEEYIREFGYQCLRDEIDLSIARMSEDEGILSDRIEGAIIPGQAGIGEPVNLMDRLKGIKRKNLLGWDGILIRIIYYYLKRYNTLREENRALILKGLHFIRRLLLKIAGEEPFCSWLDEGRDIFHLSLGDLNSGLEPKDIKRRISLNKGQYFKALSSSSSPLIYRDEVKKNFIHPTPWIKTGRKHLSGIPVCSGKVRGRATVFEGDTVPHKGDILICPRPETNLSIFFGNINGIVLEGGGQSSHLCLTAQEFNLPCLTQVYNATRLIPDGASITLDAEKGIVEIEGQETVGNNSDAN